MRLFFAALLVVAFGASCAKKPAVETGLPSEDDGSGGGTGGGGGGGGGTIVQGDYAIMFVTTGTLNGSGGTGSNLGSGVSAFDALCASEATAKNFGSTFKAFVRDSTGTRGTGLEASVEYRREDLTTIIGTSDGSKMINYPLANAVTTTLRTPWTGLYADGGIWYNGALCNDWQDNTNMNSGSYGKTTLTSETTYTDTWGNTVARGPLGWSENNDTSNTCDTLHPVICVQKYVPVLSGSVKKMFLSTTKVRGGYDSSGFGTPAQGRNMMDAACAADATSQGLSGTYKAMMSGYGVGMESPIRRACSTNNCSGGPGEHIDWVLAADTHYVRVDGTWIGKTNANAIFDFPLRNPISATTGEYWTGFTSTWAAMPPDGSTHGTCLNRSFYSTAKATVGDANSATSLALQSGGQACNSMQSVVCAEQ